MILWIHAIGQRFAQCCDRADDGEVGDAAMRLGRVVGDDHDSGMRSEQAPRLIGVLAERCGADDHNEVVGLERLAHAGGVGWEMTGEPLMILREASACSEWLLPDGAGNAIHQVRQCAPGGWIVCAGSDD
jgi:hypothetical protein